MDAHPKTTRVISELADKSSTKSIIIPRHQIDLVSRLSTLLLDDNLTMKLERDLLYPTVESAFVYGMQC